MSNNIPRRSRQDKLTKAEALIHDAIQAVEEIGAHPSLTDIVIQLVKTKNDLSDFLESDAHTDTAPTPINGTCPRGYKYNSGNNTCVLDLD